MKKKVVLLMIIASIASVVLITGMSNVPVAKSVAPTKTVKSVFAKFNLINAETGFRQNLGEVIAGKTAIVNIWATWCPPCRGEIPDLIAVYNQYKDKNVVIVGVSVDESGAAGVKKFMKDNGMNYLVLMDDGSVSKEFAVRGIPTTLFVDSKGSVVFKKVGADSKEFFAGQIDKIINK